MRLQSLGLVVLLLAGCGHAGTPLVTSSAASPLEAKAASEIFPTDVGHTWQYAVVAHPQDEPDRDLVGSETVSIDAVRRSGRGTTVTLRDIDSYTEHYRFATVSFDNDKLVIAGVSYVGAGASEAQDLAIDFLHDRLVQGGELPGRGGSRAHCSTIASRLPARKPNGQL